MTYVVEMKEIEKSFGENYVLKKVDFKLKKGSIHALLGENGTGKSTLMNILGNVISKDSGFIRVNNQEINGAESEDYLNQISFIHQELSLVNDLNIYENLFLGRELKRGIALDKERMIAETEAYIKQLNLSLDPRTKVRELNPAYKQIIEILRALMKDSQVIIMDEPTSSLTDIEIQHIFSIMETLRDSGVSMIFISHKLNEVLEICDEYTIMRDGKVVKTGLITAETTEKELSKAMVGSDVEIEGIYQERPIGERILELKAMSKDRQFINVDLNLQKGEIIGITGLLGDGRSELMASVFGANYPYQGQVLINDKEVKMRTTEIGRHHGLAYVPKNRKENGIIKDLSIRDNMLLPIMGEDNIVRHINWQKGQEAVKHHVDKLRIRLANAKDLITVLSGGNQQKVVLAKALVTNPEIVILDNPTQGVDIGAKIEIYHLIHQLAKEGISFIILSSEINEIKSLCDRAYVMFHGRIVKEFNHEEINEADVMYAATGGI